MPRTRKSAPQLTAQQRRRQIIDLLAAGLARMPAAIAIPATSPPDPQPDQAEQKVSEKAETGLDVSAN